MGAGVAGVVLFAGLTFAALSLSKRSTSSKWFCLFWLPRMNFTKWVVVIMSMLSFSDAFDF